MERNKHTKTGAYRGPIGRLVHDRPISACELQWQSSITDLSLDYLLSTQLKIAISSGRSSVNVLDIGSGDAGLFKGVVHHPARIPETMNLLTANGSIRVDMLGLTDAKTSEDHLKEASNIYPPEGSPFSVKNIGYTLTAAQTLREFLIHLGNPKIDLILATCSLQYLGPLTFNQTIRDALDSLRASGSLMLAAVYSNLAPGVIIDSAKNFRFTIPGNKDGNPHQSKALKFKGDRYGKDPSDNEVKVLLSTINKLRELGALEEECASGLIEKVTQHTHPETLFALQSIITVGLRRAETTLAKKHIERLKEKKTEALEKIKSDYADTLELKVNSKGFTGFLAVKI